MPHLSTLPAPAAVPVQRRDATGLRPGESARLAGFAHPRMAAMMLELGCRPGARIRLLRRGFFHGPLYLEVDGRTLAFREEEARALLLTDSLPVAP